MVHQPKTIRVNRDTELFSVLAEAKSTPVRLEKDGVIYLLTRDDDDLWRDYDPEAVRHALATHAGSISPEDGEMLKEYLYRAREEGTRPADRP
jgi:hypothetical protein